MAKKRKSYSPRRRRNLFKQQKGKCYHCRGEMVLFDFRQLIKYKLNKLGQKVKIQTGTLQIPDNAVTIDHLYDRYDPRRNDYMPDKERTVGACMKCNHELGRDRCKRFGRPNRCEPYNKAEDNKLLIELALREE